jgi:hypothetical protein
MTHMRLFSAASLAAALGVMLSSSVHGQSPASPKPVHRPAQTIVRTPDGQPDIQGLWNSIDAFFTPLERPSKLAGKDNVSDEELNDVLREEAQRKVDGALTAGVGSYGREWYEYKEGRIDRRPSLVVDPPDGRIPPLTSWAREKTAFVRAHATDSYEFLDPGDRCVTRGILGMMLPTFYNNGKQIVQARGYLSIMSEMIHDVRVIPVDGRPHAPPAVRTWTGDSRGRWDGSTLVVETTNFLPRDVLRGIRLQSESLKMTERFTLVDANTLMYRATIDDPKVYTRPWTIEIPFKRDNDYRMFEYACHEGNHAVEGILRGARVGESAATKRKQQ